MWDRILLAPRWSLDRLEEGACFERGKHIVVKWRRNRTKEKDNYYFLANLIVSFHLIPQM